MLREVKKTSGRPPIDRTTPSGQLSASIQAVGNGCRTRKDAEGICYLSCESKLRSEVRGSAGGQRLGKQVLGSSIAVYCFAYGLEEWRPCPFPGVFEERCKCAYRTSLKRIPFTGGPFLANPKHCIYCTPVLLASLPQHSGRAGKLDRSHPPPRA